MTASLETNLVIQKIDLDPPLLELTMCSFQMEEFKQLNTQWTVMLDTKQLSTTKEDIKGLITLLWNMDIQKQCKYL